MIWYSGPHIGVRHDSRIYRESPPPLVPGERLLGDKAYVGHASLIAPFKRNPPRGLSRRKRAYNVLHSWYRVTIEHCFAYLKRSASIHSVSNRSESMWIDAHDFVLSFLLGFAS